MRVSRTAKVIATAAVTALFGTGAALANVGGPDVSKYQHPYGVAINWSSAKSSGASFAFVKATESTSYTNPYFAQDWAGLRSAGMIRGAYHFARPSTGSGSAAAQARHFAAVVGAHRAGDLPGVLDLEVTGGLSVAQLQSWTATWLSTVTSLTGRRPIIYTSPYFWRTAMGGSSGFRAYPLWVASWNPTRPTLPTGFTTWTFWQYTDKGSTGGIRGNVDLNYFNGSLSQLQAFAGGGSVPPAVPLKASVRRLAGSDRYATNVAASSAGWRPGAARAAVLARGDLAADALPGAALSATVGGPLLITPPSGLDERIGAELTRSLGVGTGKTVYLLGSSAALSSAVESSVRSLGFRTVRISGADRFATSLAIAHAEGDPSRVYLADGLGYVDALVAANAAAAHGGSVLLTSGSTLPPGYAAYLRGRVVTAIGAPAHAAYPAAHADLGADRYATAAATARDAFGATPTAVKVVTASSFPDGLSAAMFAPGASGPLVFAGPGVPPSETAYLSTLHATRVWAFGSDAAVPNDSANVVATAAHAG